MHDIIGSAMHRQIRTIVGIASLSSPNVVVLLANSHICQIATSVRIPTLAQCGSRYTDRWVLIMTVDRVHIPCGSCDGDGDSTVEYAAMGPIRDGDGKMLIEKGRVESMVIPVDCPYCAGTGRIAFLAKD